MEEKRANDEVRVVGGAEVMHAQYPPHFLGLFYHGALFGPAHVRIYRVHGYLDRVSSLCFARVPPLLAASLSSDGALPLSFGVGIPPLVLVAERSSRHA